MSTGNLELYSVILKGNSDPICLRSLIDAARQVLTLDQDENCGIKFNICCFINEIFKK